MLEDNKFNLYFAGICCKAGLQRIRDRSCNQLLSQLNDRREIKKWVTYFQEHPECKSKLFIDSGAFSAHTKGKVVDVDDYINFMNEIDQYVHVFAQVDKIPGVFGKPKTPEQLASAPKESWDNYLYMKDRVKSVDKLLPVFHQGEDFYWLRNMLEFTHEDGHHIPYIGISPANDVSVKEKTKWLVEVFRVIKNSSNPDVKTHAFGMTSLHLLEQFPFTSADSTTWVMTAANGNVLTKHGTIRVSEQTKSSADHILQQAPSVVQSFEAYLNSYGFTLQEMIDSADQRKVYHVEYLKKWCDNYKFRGYGIYMKSLI